MKKILIFALLLTFLDAAEQLSTIVSAPVSGLIENANHANQDNVIYVQLNIDALSNNTNKKTQDAITIHLDASTEVVIYIDKVKTKKGKEDFSWFGNNKQEHIKAIFSIRNTLLVGTIKVNSDTYKISPVGTIYKIEKLDPSKIQPFHQDTLPEKPKKSISGVNFTTTEPNLAFANMASDTTVNFESIESDTTVDIALFYTSDFKLEHGMATDAVIQNLFDTAQNAYSDSLTQVNLNLVYIGQVPVSSTLNDTSDLAVTLPQMASDGYIQHIRLQYNADVVTLIGKFAASVGYCGLGYKPEDQSSNMTNAFSVVLNGTDQGYYCSDLTLAHEVGHNFACSHDADHATTSMYPYAYGYDIIDKFATIMSYDSPEINYFSNPNINDALYGLPIGDTSTADNSRMIKENKLKMADNNNEIDESLEADDSQNGLDINSHLSTNIDRDSYAVNLGGETTFTADNIGYSCWYFYINLYDKDYNLIFSSDANSGTGCDTTAQVTLSNGTYKMMVFNNRWLTGDDQHYLINIDTEYKPSNSSLPSIISYLLF